jgi:hypothetical protein
MIDVCSKSIGKCQVKQLRCKRPTMPSHAKLQRMIHKTCANAGSGAKFFAKVQIKMLASSYTELDQKYILILLVYFLVIIFLKKNIVSLKFDVHLIK